MLPVFRVPILSVCFRYMRFLSGYSWVFTYTLSMTLSVVCAGIYVAIGWYFDAVVQQVRVCVCSRQHVCCLVVPRKQLTPVLLFLRAMSRYTR